MKAYTSTIERWKFILQDINLKSSITVKKLAEKFKVSKVTILKDLTHLEKKKQLIKVRGGAALSQKSCSEDEFSITVKQQQHFLEKQLIGKASALLIKENDTLIFDSGPRTCELAYNLDQFQNLTVITNALNIALIFLDYKRFSINIPGGYLIYV